MDTYPVNTYHTPSMLWTNAINETHEHARQTWTTSHIIPRDACIAYIAEFDKCTRTAAANAIQALETFVVTWKVGDETVMVSGLKGEQCLSRYAFIYDCLQSYFTGDCPDPRHLATATKFAREILDMIKEWANLPMQDIYSSTVKVPEFSLDHARITIEVTCMISNTKAAQIASEVTETDTDNASVASLYRHAHVLASKVAQYRTRGMHSNRTQWLIAKANEQVDILLGRCMYYTIQRARLLNKWSDATACVRHLGNKRYMSDDLRRLCVLVEDHVTVLSSAQETHQCNNARFEWGLVPPACCILKDVCGIN